MNKYLLVAASLLVLASAASAADQSACQPNPFAQYDVKCVVSDMMNDPRMKGATGIYYPEWKIVYINSKAWEFRPDCKGYIVAHELRHVQLEIERPGNPWNEKQAMFDAPVYNCASFGVQYEGGQLRKPPGF